MVYALSAAITVTAPAFEGVVIHDVSAPTTTAYQFAYIAGERTDDLAVINEQRMYEGRTYPVVDFGTGQSRDVKMSARVPKGSDWRAGVNKMMQFSQTRRTLCYRDGRGRKVFGVMGACTQGDDPVGSTFGISVRRVNYSEGVYLPVAVPVFSEFDFTYIRANNPARTDVYDGQGWAATFTDNCRTVTLRGPTRTLDEQFKPFLDEFLRDRTASLGPSDGGGNWVLSGGADADYSISGGKVRVSVTSTGVARRAFLSNDNIAAPVVVMRGISTNKLASGADQIQGPLLCASGTSNYYHPRLVVEDDNSITISIQKRLNNVDSTLASAVTLASAATYATNQEWDIKAQVTSGGIVRARAWLSGTTEPGTWQVTAGDTDFTAGRVGMRWICNTGTANLPVQFSDSEFEVVEGEWVAPSIPTIVSNVYVHFLDFPFTGTVSTDWLRTKLLAPAGDVIATAFQYINNAAPVMDGLLQIGGDASYGPAYNTDRSFDLGHASDGTRQEGSDWSDYLGVTGTYDNGDSDPPEAHQFQCLDCSGLVRMVYGYRHGIPLTTDTTLDGSAIPRTSFNILLYGPGIIVVQGNPPALSALRVGDIVAFDADTSNPDEQEGQVDHLGIYLGVDIYGHHRFLSARKTNDGTTMADVGGNSLIDGTGLYARTLIGARRV